MSLSRSDVQRLLAEHGIRPSKALGQHFVADPNTVERIVRLAQVAAGDTVVEVGAGLGSLTLALAEAGAHVVAIELDTRLSGILAEVVAGRAVEVVTADALHVDFERLAGGRSGPVALVANLPYNVATPLLIGVLEDAPVIARLFVMVQREVGERWVAGPGDPAYGAVSVKIAYWATATLAGRVPPTVFVPRPKVDSVLVSVVRRPAPALDPDDVPYRRFEAVVRAGFGQRRKMLRRSLAGLVDEAAFEAAGVAPTARAEELDVVTWGALARERR